MTFRVSRQELNRRLKAFTALALTWLGTQTLVTITLPPTPKLLIGVYTASLAAVLVVIWLLTAYFFYHRYAQVHIQLSRNTITRITPKATYSYKLSDVTKIHTVMTTRGLIRQMDFTTRGGSRFNFDGLQDFGAFRLQVLAACPSAQHSVTTEPIDYDHKLFYPVLGVLLGLLAITLVLGVYSWHWLINFLGPAIFLFCVAVGLFFAGMRPVARQYGAKAAAVDYLIALVLFAMVVALIAV